MSDACPPARSEVRPAVKITRAQAAPEAAGKGAGGAHAAAWGQRGLSGLCDVCQGGQWMRPPTHSPCQAVRALPACPLTFLLPSLLCVGKSEAAVTERRAPPSGVLSGVQQGLANPRNPCSRASLPPLRGCPKFSPKLAAPPLANILNTRQAKRTQDRTDRFLLSVSTGRQGPPVPRQAGAQIL